jgi:hypothetical protein
MTAQLQEKLEKTKKKNNKKSYVLKKLKKTKFFAHIILVTPIMRCII